MMNLLLGEWQLLSLICSRPISRAGLEAHGIDFEQVRPQLEALYLQGAIGFDVEHKLFLPPGFKQIIELMRTATWGFATLETLEQAAGVVGLKPWLDHFVQSGLLNFDTATQQYSLAEKWILTDLARIALPAKSSNRA